MRWRRWLVLWSLWATRLLPPRAPLTLPGGQLEGEMAPDGSHRRFLALPYATLSPHHRFQNPGPEPTWEGVFQANREHIRCAQSYIFGTEDCLVLNVYTPTEIDSLLPVMVFIHGGGFHSGSGNGHLYGPKYLVQENVILITVNYRLYAEGFTCLGIKEAPGNAALKDQVAALKWIQRNIKVFGGDPDNVTLFGQSAGGASVSLHILSQMSKGLFHKVIIQSGSSIAPWVVQFDPVSVAKSIAESMGFRTDSPSEIYSLFKSIPPNVLMHKELPRKHGSTLISNFIFMPCIEKPVNGVEHFITEDPFTLLSSGKYNKVPMMIGSNDEEGMFIATFDKLIDKAILANSLPQNLDFPSNAEREETIKKLTDLYFNNYDELGQDFVNFTRFIGDVAFVYPAVMETELLMTTSTQPVYHYSFRYRGLRNMVSLLALLRLGARALVPAATHADELFYLFSQFWLPHMGEYEMIKRMTTMWTNFAKYSDPTPSDSPIRWRPTTPDAPRKLLIDSQLREVPLWNSETLSRLKQIYDSYRI